MQVCRAVITLAHMPNDKRFATFLRDLSAQLKVDHYPLTPATKVLDAYADELDPPSVPVVDMTSADQESADASTKHAPRNKR